MQKTDTAPGPATEGAKIVLETPDELRLSQLYRSFGPEAKRFMKAVMDTVQKITAEVEAGTATWSEYNSSAGSADPAFVTPAFFDRLEREHPEDADFIRRARTVVLTRQVSGVPTEEGGTGNA